jgi:hypothetical protein
MLALPFGTVLRLLLQLRELGVDGARDLLHLHAGIGGFDRDGEANPVFVLLRNQGPEFIEAAIFLILAGFGAPAALLRTKEKELQTVAEFAPRL